MKNALILLAIVVLAPACAERTRSLQRYETLQSPGQSTWADMIEDWPESARNAAREMGQKYGAPDEVTDTQLVWYERGPWKRSVLSREEVHHAWPTPHVDVLEQVIDFRVPPERADELAKFDGSVMFERTKGELSARCGGEPANFLAVNLAREIALGKRSVADARAFYEQAMAEASAGSKSPYMQGLMFAVADQPTEDPDRAGAVKPGAKPKRGRSEAPMSKRAEAEPKAGLPKASEF